MIPKIIHYCWFSGEKKPRLIRRCIRSWKKILPEYEIRCWDANSFDFDSVPYVKEAFRLKKWAFVSDYVRFYALYKYGGIYLDTDVEVRKRLDSFLDTDFFCGTEVFRNGTYVGINPDAAQLGSCAGNPILKDCMNYYENHEFIIPEEGIAHIVTSPILLGKVLTKYGYLYKDEYQVLENNITIYPNSVLSHVYTPSKDKSYTVHYFENSWIRDKQRGRFFRFCQKHNMMWLYSSMEKFIGKMRNKY